MTKQEIGDMLGTLCVYYPANMLEVSEITINAWWAMFHDRSFDEVMKAVKAFVATDTAGFFPNPGKIMEQLSRLTDVSHSMNEHEAWALVEKATSDGLWGSVEQFAKLPKMVQDIVGSSGQLKEWAAMDSQEFHTVVASNFMRSWRAKQATAKREFMLPTDVRAFAVAYAERAIGGSTAGLLEGGI